MQLQENDSTNKIALTADAEGREPERGRDRTLEDDDRKLIIRSSSPNTTTDEGTWPTFIGDF